MKDGKYQVMVVEDQKMPKDLFVHMISESEKYEVALTLENASIADVALLKYDIDLILMDVITENGANGLVASEKIKKSYPDIKIIIVTSMPEFSYLERAKNIGIEGFWYKEGTEESILSVMDRVMNGEIVYPDKTQKVTVGLATNEEFTYRELEILRLMTGGYSNVEIAQRLKVSPGVIKNHVANMLVKTGFRSRTQLAVRARETGLVILDEKDA